MWFKRKINPEKIKLNNTKELCLIGIDVIEHLPYLETPEFRNSTEIARRMMVLTALFQLNLNAPRAVIKNWILENQLENSLTVKENRFLDIEYKDLTDQEKNDIYWYVESVWTFAWAAGLHNNLTLNTGVEGSLSDLTPNIANNASAKSFITNFKLQGEKKIFIMLDKLYRAHWFARNNNLKGITSKYVDLDIIMERRKALEYICFKNEEWDEITLDT